MVAPVYFSEGWLVAERAVQLVSGRADALTGRYFNVTEDFDAIVERTDAILQDDLMTLRLRL